VADVSLTVVGAGVVGLAVAERLAPRHPDLLLLERRERAGTETSSRNSEVVHAGLYYTPGSWKARLCVAGRDMLYERCARRGIPHLRTEKIVTATEQGDLPALDALLERGRANGVELRRLSAAEVRALEPAVHTHGGLLSPSTGIVSAHGLMDDLLAGARAAGATLQPRTELVAAERRDADYRLTVRGPEGLESFTSERVVNAAGLESDTVAGLFGVDVDAAGYRLHWCRGRYFAASPRQAGIVSRLVYPAPGPVSLGVHAVLGLDGRLRFGPDAEYLPARVLDYRVDEGLAPAFAEAVRRLVPAVTEAELTPDIAGIRAKLQGPGEGFRDFVIAEESARGRPGLVNLVGIDSPGLTSALAIAAEVERLLA
jgi:L-2-hydroxyglutarate oxidase LhgO